MKKNRTLRIVSLCLAFMLFASSTGFSIDFHYCQGELKSTQINGKAKKCHELAGKTKHCAHHQDQETSVDKTCSEDESDDCCSNEIEYFKSDQDQINSVQTINTEILSSYFLIAFVNTYLGNVGLENAQKCRFRVYKPPLIPKDIPIVHQSFLL